MSNLIKGIDVSAIQGNVDWQSVVNAGYQFTICRAGVGNGGIDACYHKNMAGAKAAGLKTMAYNFIYPLPTIISQPLRDPVKQAQYHFNAVGGDLAAMDFEWPVPQDWNKWGVNATFINDWALTYLQEYERLSGQKMVVYTYPYFAQALKLPADFAQYPLWIASYTTNPTIPHPWTDWVLWQNSGGTQHLPNGVPVDGDYAKDLSLWNVIAPTPVVEPIPDHQPDPPVAPTPVVPAPVAPVPVVQPAPSSPGILVTIWNMFGNFWKNH